MKRLLILLFSIVVAGEMEVDGDLKVTGTVDASGNPITNVGAALSMTDAINGNVLQSALRDDGVYEYKILCIYIVWANAAGLGYITDASRWVDLDEIDDIGNYQANFYNSLNTLSTHVSTLINDGWMLDSINSGGDHDSFWIFKRPVQE